MSERGQNQRSAPGKPYGQRPGCYKELDDSLGWLPAKCCGDLPAVWSFNNGLFARCLCGDLYRDDDARAESIGSVLARTGGFSEYSEKPLMERWNHYVETGETLLSLPEGRW